MQFNQVINGIAKYLNKQIFPNMNSWQETLARVFVSRFMNNQAKVKQMLEENPFIRTFAIFDENGEVDVEGIMADVKTAIREKGCIEFELPLFGYFKFTENDVDVLHNYIKGGN